MNKPLAENVSDLLAECLAAAGTGDAGLAAYLAQHPDKEAAWHDLVSLALELQHMPVEPPTTAFRSRGYQNLMLEIGQKSGWRWQLRRLLRLPLALFANKRSQAIPAWGVAFAAAILILCLGGGGAVLAAEDALPGDPLYALKTTVEEVRLAVAPAAGDVGLHARFAGRRLDEIEALVAANRLADVPQAAANYEAQVGQALRELATAQAQDTGARDRLATQLDQMLSEQTATLNVLAARAPAVVAPAIQQAQATSASAHNMIRQLRNEPNAPPTPATTPVAPMPEPTVMPPAVTPPPERPHPVGQATTVPTEPPGQTQARPLPGGARLTPPNDRSREPRLAPDQPPPVTPHTTGAGTSPTRPAPPPPFTPAPPAETSPASTPKTSPSPDGAPPGHHETNTPPLARTPAAPAETPPANMPPAGPPHDGSPLGRPPAGAPPSHTDSQGNSGESAPFGSPDAVADPAQPDGPPLHQPPGSAP